MDAIIIEDEVNVREAFIKSLGAFCPDVHVQSYASNVGEGVALIDQSDFDILFLDINLPDGSGFDLLEKVQNQNYAIIFVTAYDEHAIQAFKLSAVDYLLKPVSPDLLISAIQKVRKLHESNNSALVQVAASHLDSTYDQNKKIILKDQDSMYIKHISDIVYCMAEGSYTRFKFNDGSVILTSSNLKEYEQLLTPFKFSRNHHSYLSNLHHVKELRKIDGGSLLMTDGSLIPISARKKAGILEQMKSIFIN